ncbi:hypothetical protein AAHN97_14990 [Chitinophaga niabensis]|uniref:hypothetical protein n=1 Tax=Chitinophaga niabensis TaxID=536979 RepID=UPI0031BB42A0
MRTSFTAVDIVWTRLKTSPLSAAISGGIYKHGRPLNSGKEDCVVNSLPISGAQLQEGVLNVNIHVPNIVIVSEGNQDATQPNSPRLDELTRIAIDRLTDAWEESGDVNFTIEQQVLIQEDSINEHYSNIRLTFFSVNV